MRKTSSTPKNAPIYIYRERGIFRRLARIFLFKAALVAAFVFFSVVVFAQSTVTLTSSTGAITLTDGQTLTGTGGAETHVTIANGATITLSGVSISNITEDNSHRWAGITCAGDATIILANGTTNTVVGGGWGAGIFIPKGYILTIKGSGTLIARGYNKAAGIGANAGVNCGNIVIEDGVITATGGDHGAGIGSCEGYNSSASTCGNITITGGTITATGGRSAAGIGSGYDYTTCGNILISGGTITAKGGNAGAGIGSGSCGYIDKQSKCGNITITGGTITATKGENAKNSIGVGGSKALCGTVTIGGAVGAISTSPYTITVIPATYSIIFNANGGSGSMSNQTINVNITTPLTRNSFTREGYYFTGWSNTAEGDVEYVNGQSVTDLAASDGTKILYAKWVSKENLPTGIQVDADYLENQTGFYYVNMPINDATTTVNINDLKYFPLMIYDDGGKDKNATKKGNGYLTIFSPSGYNVNLTGKVLGTKMQYMAELNIFEGSNANASSLGKFNSSNTISVSSTGSSITLYFNNSYGEDLEGLKLTATTSIINYSITYNVTDGATFATDNPTSYTVESEDITLVNPTKEGYEFVGWTYEGQTVPNRTITIPKGSYGDKEFTANWAQNLNDANVANISDQTYNGSAIAPEVIVTDGETTLVKGVDYTVTYSNNINAGTSAKATITGKGNYKGTIEKTFTINAKALVANNVANISAQTYTGSAIEPTVTVTEGTKTLVKGTDYTVTYSNNINAGTSAKATITGKGNYKGTIEKTFTINAKALAASNVANISAQTYTGSAIEPTVTVTEGTKTLVKGTDYTVTYSNNTNAGMSAKATITGKGNYTGTVEKTFTINAKALVANNIADISAQTYTGSAIEPEITVTDGTKTLVKGSDYTVEYSGNINTGTSAKATITGKGNYKGTIEKTFTINAKTLAANDISVESATFTGSALTPMVTCDAITLKEGLDYNITLPESGCINAKDYTITITGKGNYKGTIEKTFTINAKTLIASNVADIAAQTYTGSAIEPEVTVSDGAKTLVKGTDYTVTYSGNINTGTSAKATITGKGNYKGTIEKTFSINAKALTASNVANISTQTYTGSAIEPEVTVTDGSKTLVKGTDYTVEYSNNINAGTSAKVTITGKGNYTGTTEKTFTINAKALAASNVSDIAAQNYTGSAIEPEVTVTDGTKTLVKGTDYTVEYSNNINAGTSAKATVKGKGNYTGNIEKTFTINKAVPFYTTPENLTVKCNQTLADITLPTGFTFDNLNAVLTFGENNVTATFTPSVIENYEVVKNIQLTVTKTDHEYGTPTYSWSDDGKTCTANAVCKNDISHTVSENAIITSEVTTAATCETQGTTTYTATFTTALFETQTKAVQDIAAQGHTPSEAVKENEVAATTEKAGSYDEVVYCSVCHKELSRTTKTIPQLNPEEPGNQDNPEEPGNQDNPEEPGNQDNPEEPGNQDNPEEPGNQDNPEEPGNQDNPEEPGNQDNPEEPGNQDNPEEPGNQDNPENPNDPETPVSEINLRNSVKIWSFEKTVFVENAESEILIVDMSGRIVKIVKPENSRMEIRLSNGGVYIVKIGLKTQKIIIR